MRYADNSCRSALLQRLLPLREREPYSAALDMRFASRTQPDPNPLLPYGRFRAANFDRRPSTRGRYRRSIPPKRAAPTGGIGRWSTFVFWVRLCHGVRV